MSEHPPVPAPVVEQSPVQEMSEEERFRLVLIDQSHDARDQARDLADAQLTEELNKGNWLKRAVNSVWKGNLLKDYYRLKYTREHEAKIAESNDVLQSESLPEAQTKAINSLVSRFQHGDEELIHTEAGEKRTVHADDALSSGLKDLIRGYTSGRLNETTLDQAKKKLLEEYGKQNPDADLSKSLVLTDNLSEIAQAIKGRFTHDEAMERAIANMEIITGEARNGVRTEAHYSKVDKLATWISKTKVGSLVTPGTIATSVALVASVAGIGTKSVVGAAAATAGLGTVAGVWAGLRENKRVKDDRSQHAREMAAGGEVNEGDKRREEMETARYKSVTAISLESALRDKTSEEALAAGEAQQEAIKAALAALGEAHARTTLSDTQNIDLIRYSSKADVGQERISLDLARIEARKAVEAALTSEMRANLGIADEATMKGIIEGYSKAYGLEIEADMSEKDKAFRAIKRRRVATAAVTGTVVGIAGGLVAQEVIAGIDPGRYSLIESISGDTPPVNAEGDVHQTILASFVNGEQTVEHIDASATYDKFDAGGTDKSYIKVGDDMEWNQNPDGTYEIVGPDGKSAIEDVVINADGSMDQATIDRIEATGLDVKDMSWTEEVKTTTTNEISLDQYWQENTAEMQSTSIDTWYSNNSPRPDLNELRVYRGGNNGLIDGGYRFESGMTPDGSFVNGQSVNPVEAIQQGNLVWVVSRMGEDSGSMFTIPAGPDGSLTILKDDPAGAFFTDVNGRAELAEGYRMHAFYSEGVDENGVLRGGSLATMVGEAEVSTTTTSETVITQVEHHRYEITSEGYDVVNDNITEVAPITPVVGRRPLEVLKAYREAGNSPDGTDSPEGGSGYYYYGNAANVEFEKKWREERSPRLKRNPDADLNTGQELDWYRKEQIKRRGEGYVREIVGNIEGSDVLKNFDDTTEAIVCIPVAAINESENIYRTLSMFARQDSEEAISKTTVLLNVNWKEELAKDPENLEKIRKTLSEIQRAQADFPYLKVASFNKVWTEEFVREKEGKIYGEVIKVLYDTAALALDRAVQSGARSKDTEALLITNDADTEGMSRSYLRRYLDTFEQNPKQDAFTALVRRGTEAYKDYPGYGVVSGFYAMMTQTMLRRQAMGGGGFSTDGPNSGIRMSMYAAMGGVEESVGAGADGQLTHRMSNVRRSEGERSLIERLRRAPVPKGSERVMGRFVSGAAIDTVPDRLLGAYKEGKWIAQGWDSFDNGGYEDRSVSLAKGALGPENVERDINDIAARIEKSVEGFGSHWWRNPGAMKSAMIWSFGLNPEDMKNPSPDDKQLYEYIWNLDKQGSGAFTFKFTEDGKKWLRDKLERDARGRFDPYGSRLRRQLYNEVAPNRTKQPVQPAARMLT